MFYNLADLGKVRKSNFIFKCGVQEIPLCLIMLFCALICDVGCSFWYEEGHPVKIL